VTSAGENGARREEELDREERDRVQGTRVVECGLEDCWRRGVSDEERERLIVAARRAYGGRHMVEGARFRGYRAR